jgi:hypothetical protein
MIYLKTVDQGNAKGVHRIFPGVEGKYWVNFNWYWLGISKRRPLIDAKFILYKEKR